MTNHKRSLPGPDDITRHELDNGLVVLIRENHASPSVVVDGLLRGGSIFETRQQAGLASFTAEMLMRGTHSYDFDALHEAIESIGADMDVGANTSTIDFDFKSLAEDLGLMLNVLADVLRRPAFPVEHVEKVRGEIVTDLETRAHNTRSMASLKFMELAYPGGHPYGISNLGYLDSIPSLTRDDIVNFHARHFGPRGAIMTIVGAVNTDEALALVREAFGDWQNPAMPDVPQVDSITPPAEITRDFVMIPGKAQADIMLGMPGPRRNAPDFQAARLANSILGVFGMMGRLGDNVREKQGLAYYSFSRISGGTGPGPWYVSAGVSPDNVQLAVDSITHELRRMTDELVTQEELADNKTYYKGRLPLQLETNEGVAGTLAQMELHSLGLDYLHNYADQIDAVTRKAVQSAARNYLNPDAYALAVAGPDMGE